MTKRRLQYLIAPVTLLSCQAGAQTASREPETLLANPAVRLWYEETGRLSENVAPPNEATLWNTIIGEGDAEENANDALFTVDVRTDGERNIGRPLMLIATDANGKVLAHRVVRHLLTGKSGNMAAALWVADVGCAGTVVFTAELGASKRSVTVHFDCGE